MAKDKVFVRLAPLFTLMINLKQEITHYTEAMYKEQYWKDMVQALRDIERDVFSWYPHLKKFYERAEEEKKI